MRSCCWYTEHSAGFLLLLLTLEIIGKIHIYVPKSNTALENKMGLIGGSKMVRNHLKNKKQMNFNWQRKPQCKMYAFLNHS